MARFSKHFESVHDRVVELAALTTPGRSLDALFQVSESEGHLETEDAAALLAWGRDSQCRSTIHSTAKRLRDQTTPRTIEFVVPEYLTSFCQNDCLYCGYRKTNALAERVRLSPEVYEKELDLLLSWGHRQIELVLADDPEFGPEELAPYVAKTVRKLNDLGGGVVALNAPPYEEEDYHLLWQAGLGWVALWQETYDHEHFDRWHFEGSPKREYEFRLDVWDRAFAAGFTRVGLGVLFGLYDWRFDVLALIEHGNYLRKTYGIEPHAVGIPRLKPARGVLASQKPSRFTVSDEDFQLAIAVYHLAFPRTRLFFNTREEYEFNLSMVTRGDLFTVDCETLPGAYLRGRQPGQFHTHPYPSRREVVAEFVRRGYGCRYLESESPGASQPPSAGRGEASTAEVIKRCLQEHREIHSRLNAWEEFLERLQTASRFDRWVRTGELRELLRFFETEALAHCRFEESVLFPRLERSPGGGSSVPELLQEHERFGVDLDRFQRQVTSYEQSGDPTVLMNLGDRIIREFRYHLTREEEFLGDSARTAPGQNAI
ncbi:MAG: hemerythrin domain-containing protein [Terriglobia bacterium]